MILDREQGRNGERDRKSERESERVRERERNINRLHALCTLTRNGTHNLGMCSDQGLNLQPFGVWDDAPTIEPPCPGYIFLFNL